MPYSARASNKNLLEKNKINNYKIFLKRLDTKSMMMYNKYIRNKQTREKEVMNNDEY